MTAVRRTHRWRGMVAVSLFAAAIGVFAARPWVLLSAIVGVVYVAYPHVTSTPEPDLELEREVHDDGVGHGEPAMVTVRLKNTGREALPDVRIIDGVPPMLPVVGGSARHATALSPGGVASFSYQVTVNRGTHQFEPATVLARDLSGAIEVETTVATDTEIECTSQVLDVPLRSKTQYRSGRIETDHGGSGIEFHGTREYRSGDPLGRIAWKRYARSGELTTIELREERAAAVVLCLDARPAAYCGRPGEPHAVSYAITAVEELLDGLFGTRETVGVAALGREFAWLGPDTGDDHRARIRRLLASHPALSIVPPAAARDETTTHGPLVAGDGGRPARSATDLDDQSIELIKRLGDDDQVLLLSPVADEAIVETALALEARGHAVTVISPDVTTDASTGGRLAQVGRDNRIHALHAAGIRVVDWETDDPLGAALARAQEVW